jgi:hypothetical protein
MRQEGEGGRGGITLDNGTLELDALSVVKNKEVATRAQIKIGHMFVTDSFMVYLDSKRHPLGQYADLLEF